MTQSPHRTRPQRPSTCDRTAAIGAAGGIFEWKGPACCRQILVSVLVCAVATSCGHWTRFPDGYCEESANRARCQAPATSNQLATDRLAHHGFAALMAAFSIVRADGVLVDYDALVADAERLFQLDQYLALLAAVDPDQLADASERFAYWANGYNATVIRSIVDIACTAAGCDHGFSTIDDGGRFFDRPIVQLGGETLTLNQLEHGVVRGDWKRPELATAPVALRTKLQQHFAQLWPQGTPDARLHAVFNCGAFSCPDLIGAAPFVLQAALLEQQLATQTRRWLDNAKNGAGADGISSLFEWYRADFTASASSVEDFIAKHRTGGVQGVKLDTFLAYDWTLNSTANRPLPSP